MSFFEFCRFDTLSPFLGARSTSSQSGCLYAFLAQVMYFVMLSLRYFNGDGPRLRT